MNNKCCICGTVRNCGEFLDKIFQNMESLGSLFEDFKIIIYYDISNDNTLDKLKSYKEKNSKFDFYVNTDKLLIYRTHRISKGRNYCINYIRKKYNDYKYFIMMDCDNRCIRDIKLQLMNAYLMRTDWDSLSFNHPDGYYDTWALSVGPYFVSKDFYNYGQNQNKFIDIVIKKTPKNKLINCYSAFNGIAIYRTDKFLNCNYDGRFRFDYIPKSLVNKSKLVSKGIRHDYNNKEDCEHRFFHFQSICKNNARIRISPMCLFV